MCSSDLHSLSGSGGACGGGFADAGGDGVSEERDERNIGGTGSLSGNILYPLCVDYSGSASFGLARQIYVPYNCHSRFGGGQYGVPCVERTAEITVMQKNTQQFRSAVGKSVFSDCL